MRIACSSACVTHSAAAPRYSNFASLVCSNLQNSFTAHQAASGCLIQSCTQLIPLRSSSILFNEHYAHAYCSPSSRCHKQHALPCLLRVTTFKTYHSNTPAHSAGASTTAWVLTNPRHPFRRCSIVGASPPTANGSRLPSRKEKQTAFSLVLQPTARPGSRLAIYSGHTPRTT